MTRSRLMDSSPRRLRTRKRTALQVKDQHTLHRGIKMVGEVHQREMQPQERPTSRPVWMTYEVQLGV